MAVHLTIMVNNMRFKKGSKEAKAFMAKLRAAKGKSKNKKDIPDRGYKKITLDFLPIKKIGAVSKTKFKKGDLVKIKGKSWIMRVDNIQHTNSGNIYYLENDVRGTRNGNAGSYAEIDLEKISNKKVGSTLKLTPKETRLGATEKDFKPKSKSYHKDTKSHNVNIRVVSGVNKLPLFSKINNVTDKIKNSLNWIDYYSEELNWWKNYKPKNIEERKGKTNSIKFYKINLANERKHLANIKKTI
jgi:hypothetical protein